MSVLAACTSKPEQSLLKKYFNAVSLNDNATLSSMAVEPIQPDLKAWEIVSTTPEETAPATLPDLNKAEAEAKKAVDADITPTLDAQEAIEVAKQALDDARTGAARNAAKKSLDEANTKYEAQRQVHSELQKKYNDAKAAATREELITSFSLGVRDMPNIRDFGGTVHSRTVQVKITSKDGSAKTYNVAMRKYNLKDEASGMNRNGRWVIVNFEPVS